MLEQIRTSDCTAVVVSGGLGSTRCEAPSPVLEVTELRRPPRTSDCTFVVVSGGLEFTRCEAPSPVLVVTKLRELVFQLERPN